MTLIERTVTSVSAPATRTLLLAGALGLTGLLVGPVGLAWLAVGALAGFSLSGSV